MRVEVDEINILIYDLVQLTGNTAEELLRHAKEAAEHGYTLTCEIPEVDEPLEVNIFEAAGSEPSEPLEHKLHPMMVKDDVSQPCPHCGRHTLYLPTEWIEGGVIKCANPLCDSNQPPRSEYDGGEKKD